MAFEPSIYCRLPFWPSTFTRGVLKFPKIRPILKLFWKCSISIVSQWRRLGLSAALDSSWGRKKPPVRLNNLLWSLYTFLFVVFSVQIKIFLQKRAKIDKYWPKVIHREVLPSRSLAFRSLCGIQWGSINCNLMESDCMHPKWIVIQYNLYLAILSRNLNLK